jgi:hypothetical protein
MTDKELWEKSQVWESSDDGRGKLKILESVEKFAELVRADAFEQGRQEGMKQERALWTLTKLGQEIEAQRPWVGLTEVDVLAESKHWRNPEDFLNGVYWAETELKEKNT